MPCHAGLTACGNNGNTSSPAGASGKALVVYFSVPETAKPDNMNREEQNSTVVINGEVLGNTQYIAQIIQSHTGGNINQYWISSAAPEAPEFANGLFLTASNLGITIAAFLCGLFIKSGGLSAIFFGGLLILAGSAVLILLKVGVIDRSTARKTILFLKEARE